VNTGKWEMKHCMPAFRDDVYRAVQNCAMAIYDHRLKVYLQEISDEEKASPEEIERYKKIKDTAEFFELPPDLKQKNEFTLKGLVPDGVLPAIRAELRKISNEAAKENENPLTKPAYDKILRSFKRIILVLDPSFVGKENEEIFRVV
jgi:hypothetical protein